MPTAWQFKALTRILSFQNLAFYHVLSGCTMAAGVLTARARLHPCSPLARPKNMQKAHCNCNTGRQSKHASSTSWLRSGSPSAGRTSPGTSIPACRHRHLKRLQQKLATHRSNNTKRLLDNVWRLIQPLLLVLDVAGPARIQERNCADKT